jgi:hypothetical protein
LLAIVVGLVVHVCLVWAAVSVVCSFLNVPKDKREAVGYVVAPPIGFFVTLPVAIFVFYRPRQRDALSA